MFWVISVYFNIRNILPKSGTFLLGHPIYILPVVVYGCKTWSITLREICRLRLFQNWMLRRIFRPERDEITGEWRKLHNEGLNDLYSSPNIQVIKSRRMSWVGCVACMEERRDAYRVEKPEGKRLLGRPRHRWEDNIKMDLQEVGWWSMDWIDLAQDRDRLRAFVNVVMNLQVP